MEAFGTSPFPLAIRPSGPLFRNLRVPCPFWRIGRLAIFLAFALGVFAWIAPPVSAQSLPESLPKSFKGTAAPSSVNAPTESMLPAQALSPRWIPAVSITLAFALLLVFLVVAVCIPRPTPQQLLAFRVILALSAAACGATVASRAPLEMANGKRLLLSAGASLALFVMVFQIDPPGKMQADRPGGEGAREGKQG